MAAFGNSGGDREMLEWTGAGDGARLMMLVLHDDAEREYAYGPANGLPDTKVGTFSPVADGRGQAARLDGDQHEERLEDGVRCRCRNPNEDAGMQSRHLIALAGLPVLGVPAAAIADEPPVRRRSRDPRQLQQWRGHHPAADPVPGASSLRAAARRQGAGAGEVDDDAAGRPVGRLRRWLEAVRPDRPAAGLLERRDQQFQSQRPRPYSARATC